MQFLLSVYNTTEIKEKVQKKLKSGEAASACQKVSSDIELAKRRPRRPEIVFRQTYGRIISAPT